MILIIMKARGVTVIVVRIQLEYFQLILYTLDARGIKAHNPDGCPHPARRKEGVSLIVKEKNRKTGTAERIMNANTHIIVLCESVRQR